MGDQKKTVGAVVLIVVAIAALAFSYMKFFSKPKTLPLDEMLKKRQEVEAQYGGPKGLPAGGPRPPGAPRAGGPSTPSGGMSAPTGGGR
ncbi:MAG: hypothetical protein NZT92_13760 [Abditibacteriales bacterium]|nr:hypothetical protein [Abditibacteriales bacterium]MDW8366949.1 hypothetical protein [Abditibacteriales bacterium]